MNRRGDNQKNFNRPENVEMFVLVAAGENDPAVLTGLSKELSKTPGVTIESLFGDEGNKYNEYSTIINIEGQPESVGENISRALHVQEVNGKKVKILSRSGDDEESKKTVMNIVKSKKGVDKKCVIWSF